MDYEFSVQVNSKSFENSKTWERAIIKVEINGTEKSLWFKGKRVDGPHPIFDPQHSDRIMWNRFKTTMELSKQKLSH